MVIETPSSKNFTFWMISRIILLTIGKLAKLYEVEFRSGTYVCYRQ